jgi:hypothetical protein
MHNHVIAGDFGYLPTYSDEEGYTHKSEALEGLKEYVNTVVESVEVERSLLLTVVAWEAEVVSQPEFATVEEYWLDTGVVTDIGTDGCKDIIQAVFDRNLASIDYAEITVCYEDCKTS